VSEPIKLSDELTAEFDRITDGEGAIHMLMEALFTRSRIFAAERRQLWERAKAQTNLDPAKNYKYVVGVGLVEI